MQIGMLGAGRVAQAVAGHAWAIASSCGRALAAVSPGIPGLVPVNADAAAGVNVEP